MQPRLRGHPVHGRRVEHQQHGQPDGRPLGLDGDAVRPGHGRERVRQLPPGRRGSHVSERAPGGAGRRHHPGPDVRDRNLARRLALRAEPHRVSRPHRRERGEEGRRVRPLRHRPTRRSCAGTSACRTSTRTRRRRDGGSDERERARNPACAQPVRPGPDAGRTTGTTRSSRTTPRRSTTPSSRSCGARRAATTRRALPSRARPSASETRSS